MSTAKDSNLGLQNFSVNKHFSNEFDDLLAEVENSFKDVDEKEFSENVVSLIKKQNDDYDLTRLCQNVVENAHLLAPDQAKLYQCLVLFRDYSPYRFHVGVAIEKYNSIDNKTAISRALEVFSTAAIKYVPLEENKFNYLFNEAYGTKSLALKSKQNSRSWKNEQSQIDLEDEVGGKTVEDFSGKRVDCSDLNEYERLTEAFENGSLHEAELDILQFVIYILQDFIKSQGSDLHIASSSAEGGVIRYRVDGKLYTRWENIPLSRINLIINSLCILASKNHGDMARLSISSVIKLKINYGGEIKNSEFRFQSIPSSPLPTVILRGQSAPIRDISKLGFFPEQIKLLEQIIQAENGIILVTGATGSGKTNTLESMMAILEKDYQWNIIEVGDPVEIESSRRVQITLSRKSIKEKDSQYEDAFADCLRSDPDIIYFTELRTARVASIAIEASISGHQVFSTLHAADSEETLTRLFKMGIPNDLIAKGVLAICSQKLVRKLCRFCKIKDSSVSLLANTEVFVEYEKGCPHCTNGFLGRTAIAEILILDEEIKNWILEGKKPSQIIQLAIEKKGFQPMKKIALRKVLNGETSESEVRNILDLSAFYKDSEKFDSERIEEDYFEGEIVNV